LPIFCAVALNPRLHPDIWISLTALVSTIPQCGYHVVPPPCPTRLQSIQGSDNQDGSSGFVLAKFLTSGGIDFLCSRGVQVGVLDVGTKDLKVVESC
jgi:hypothetical protein